MPRQSSHKSIAIIGGGFSGALVAINLLRQANSPLEIVLISKSPEIGRGVAYSTKDENHLLNVPAANMSAFPEEPNHFLEWLEQSDFLPNPKAFYPRKLYGDYIQSQFAKVKDKLQIIHSSAVDFVIDNEDVEILLENGQSINVGYVVLAIGNFPAVITNAQRALFQLKDRVIHNPWAGFERIKKIEKDAEILIIGTGLTMVDVVTSLIKQGHEGKITAISRNGKLPEAHIATKPSYEISLPSENRVLPLLKFVRAEIEAASKKSIPWQSVFDALRPHTQALWQSLPIAEKRRFMRHLRIWWDTRRHRMSEQIFDILQANRDEKKLIIRAARILLINPVKEKFEVVFKPRGSNTPVVSKNFDYVINCTTPETNLEEVSDPLIRNLLAKEIIKTGSLRMGAKVNSVGALIGKGDIAAVNIFAIGSIQKGELWETVAIPELRVQARNLATTILEAIGNSEQVRQGAWI